MNLVLQKPCFWKIKMKFKKKKSLGQNFLVNPRILDKIVEAADSEKNDIALEIGAGIGNLTEKLAKKFGKVIAIEKDHRLIEPLQKKFQNTNVEIIEGDILKLDIGKLFRNSHYKVIGNIPYYITSRFLRTVFEKWPKPELIVLTIQKEVAQRIVAKPPKMNLLAVSVQFFAEPEIIAYISKENFRPRPKVDSAIIKLVPKSKFYILNSKFFFKVARAGFSQKRKILISNLSTKLKLKKEGLTKVFEELGLSLKIRAENLNLDDWKNLARTLKIK